MKRIEGRPIGLFGCGSKADEVEVRGLHGVGMILTGEFVITGEDIDFSRRLRLFTVQKSFVWCRGKRVVPPWYIFGFSAKFGCGDGVRGGICI